MPGRSSSFTPAQGPIQGPGAGQVGSARRGVPLLRKSDGLWVMVIAIQFLVELPHHRRGGCIGKLASPGECSIESSSSLWIFLNTAQVTSIRAATAFSDDGDRYW